MSLYELLHSIITRITPIEYGGTGAVTAESALTNLGVNDYVVEEGTSGIWHYVKYASGYVELHGFKTASVSLTVAWGYSFYGTAVPESAYPFELKEVYFSDATLRHNQGWHGYSYTQTSPSLTASQNIYPIGASKITTAFTAYVEYIVKGRWK